MAGISGVGVGIVTAGALLIYAGLKDVSPLDALRAVAGGQPLPVSAAAAEVPSTLPATPGASGQSGLPRSPRAIEGPDPGVGGGSAGGSGGSW